jgi:hypothetical protein
MDTALLYALVAASLLIGATGTWSPCGFSMVETIGPTGHTGGRPTTLAACLTFLPGALVGAVFTFGGLALIGAAVPGDAGWIAYAVAVAVALVAAIAEARGARIAPQIRRQLPEHWRRIMPMPVAAALYGILLGLGFTTFVLTFGVWALAGISLALGEPVAGLAIGLGFGVGRAIPVVTLAPFADHPLGRRAITLMAERPGLYRAIRLGDALALVVAAAALLFAGTAQAQEPDPQDERAVPQRIEGASDPSASRFDLAYSSGPGDNAILDEGSGPVEIPGVTDPALDENYLVAIDGNMVRLFERETLTETDSFAAQGVDAVAVAQKWLAFRTRKKGTDRLIYRRIKPNGTVQQRHRVATAKAPSQIGIPSMDRKRMVYSISERKKSRLAMKKLGGGRKILLTTRVNGMTSPSLRGKYLAYLLTTRKNSELHLKKVTNRSFGRTLFQRKRLWTTSLTKQRVYVTVLNGSLPTANIKSIDR